MTNTDRKGCQPVIMRVYNKDGQLLLEDELLCAYDIHTSKIQALGKEAYQFIEDYQVMVENPMKWGVVAEPDIYEKIAGLFIQKAMGRKTLRKPSIVICVPAKLTKVAQIAFLDLLASRARKLELNMKSYQEASVDNCYEGKNKPDLWVELVSDYYACEYFE